MERATGIEPVMWELVESFCSFHRATPAPATFESRRRPAFALRRQCLTPFGAEDGARPWGRCEHRSTGVAQVRSRGFCRSSGRKVRFFTRFSGSSASNDCLPHAPDASPRRRRRRSAHVRGARKPPSPVSRVWCGGAYAHCGGSHARGIEIRAAHTSWRLGWDSEGRRAGGRGWQENGLVFPNRYGGPA